MSHRADNAARHAPLGMGAVAIEPLAGEIGSYARRRVAGRGWAGASLAPQLGAQQVQRRVDVVPFDAAEAEEEAGLCRGFP